MGYETMIKLLPIILIASCAPITTDEPFILAPCLFVCENQLNYEANTSESGSVTGGSQKEEAGADVAIPAL